MLEIREETMKEKEKAFINCRSLFQQLTLFLPESLSALIHDLKKSKKNIKKRRTILSYNMERNLLLSNLSFWSPTWVSIRKKSIWKMRQSHASKIRASGPDFAAGTRQCAFSWLDQGQMPWSFASCLILLSRSFWYFWFCVIWTCISPDLSSILGSNISSWSSLPWCPRHPN